MPADAAGNAFVDWAGVVHAPAGPSPRIASLVPSLTELLFALGLGACVVARTGFCVRPDAARRVPKVGGTKDPDLARLAALAPTHLVVNVDENRREDVAAAGEFVPHVIVTHPMGPRRQPAAARAAGRGLRPRARSGRAVGRLHRARARTRGG